MFADFEPSTGNNCIVTGKEILHNLIGWCFQEESSSFSPKLREIRVQIIPIVVCNNILHYFGRVDSFSCFVSVPVILMLVRWSTDVLQQCTSTMRTIGNGQLGS
uniref:Uncharacterized protein n=1 Tax=Onchocerca volvulus TaxID=6282 RepID=A0A8R1XSU7_ONCVO